MGLLPPFKESLMDIHKNWLFRVLHHKLQRPIIALAQLNRLSLFNECQKLGPIN